MNKFYCIAPNNGVYHTEACTTQCADCKKLEDNLTEVEPNPEGKVKVEDKVKAAKRGLLHIIGGFPQVIGAGVRSGTGIPDWENVIVVYLNEEIPSFPTEFEGVKVMTEVKKPATFLNQDDRGLSPEEKYDHTGLMGKNEVEALAFLAEEIEVEEGLKRLAKDAFLAGANREGYEQTPHDKLLYPAPPDFEDWWKEKKGSVSAQASQPAQPPAAGEVVAWVAVSERLPEAGTQVLIIQDLTQWNREKRVLIADVHYSKTPIAYGGPNSLTGRGYQSGIFFSVPSILNKETVTHWMPLPTPPTTQTEGGNQ